MTHFLVQTVIVVVLSVVVALVRSRRARVRREALVDGGDVTLRARLARGSDRLDRGRLSLSPGQAVWTARTGGDRVDLAGAVVLAMTATGGAGVEAAEDVVLRLGLPGGATVRLQLYRDDAATLQRALADLDATPAPATTAEPGTAAAPGRPARQRRRPWWAISCIVLAGGWVLVWAWLVVTGHSTTATVTGGDGEGTCEVSWEDAGGTPSTGEVDCADEPAGSHRTVWVLGWPAIGEPMDPAWTAGSVLVLGGLVAAPGAFRLVQLRLRHRSDDARQTAGGPPRPPVHRLVPDLDVDDLRPVAGEQPAELANRLAHWARRQVPDDGWEVPRRPNGVTGPLRPLRLAGRLRGPAVLLALVLAGTSWWSYRWLVLETSPTDSAVAISTGDVALEGPGPLPDDVTVRYRGAGEAVHDADVATTRSLPDGMRVRVEYSTSHPGEVRLAGAGDGLTRGAAVSASGILVALLWAGWRLRNEARRVHGVHVAHRQPPRPAVGLLTADEDGDPVVLLCDPLVAPPTWLAVLVEAPLPHGTAAAFARDVALTVQGRPAAGELIVVTPAAGTGELLPAGAAVQPGPEQLVALLDTAGALARSGREDDPPATTSD